MFSPREKLPGPSIALATLLRATNGASSAFAHSTPINMIRPEILIAFYLSPACLGVDQRSALKAEREREREMRRSDVSRAGESRGGPNPPR